MGYTKDMWVDKADRIGEQLAAGNIDRQEAMRMLVLMGFDPHEAANMLDEAVS